MDVVTQLFKGSEPSESIILPANNRMCWQPNANENPALALSQEIGAFTDHTLAHGDILMKIPPHLSDAEAATFGAALTVAGMALYQVLGLKRPHEPYSRPVPILINGGATASGAMAIQLAKLYATSPPLAWLRLTKLQIRNESHYVLFARKLQLSQSPRRRCHLRLQEPRLDAHGPARLANDRTSIRHNMSQRGMGTYRTMLFAFWRARCRQSTPY